MNTTANIIKSIILPFLVFLPMTGIIACTSQDAPQATTNTLGMVSKNVADFPENFQTAAPMLHDDLQTLWTSIAGDIEVYAEEVGIEAQDHPLADVQEAREKLISGSSFDEVVANASATLTPEDLKSIPSSNLDVLNGVLPFEVDLEKCGDNLAEVLNSLDVGQVSAVLRSEYGYHLIQLLDRDGARVKIGHIVFEIDPDTRVAEQPSAQPAGEKPEGYDEAIAKLNSVLQAKWK